MEYMTGELWCSREPVLQEQGSRHKKIEPSHYCTPPLSTTGISTASPACLGLLFSRKRRPEHLSHLQQKVSPEYEKSVVEGVWAEQKGRGWQRRLARLCCCAGLADSKKMTSLLILALGRGSPPRANHPWGWGNKLEIASGIAHHQQTPVFQSKTPILTAISIRLEEPSTRHPA